MKTEPTIDAEHLVTEAFAGRRIRLEQIDVRNYPEESIIIVRVAAEDFPRAIELANDLDRQLAAQGFAGFVTVKAAEQATSPTGATRVRAISDPRLVEFVHLLTARSRTSEIQPSLAYVPDAQNNLATVTAPRHHLVFGRRGAGKTALLVEAKRRVEEQGHLCLWLNIQTYRRESADRAFLLVCEKLVEIFQADQRVRPQISRFVAQVSALDEDVKRMLAAATPDITTVARLVPRLNSTLRKFLEYSGKRLYLFLDDFHYLERDEQAHMLDMVHGTVRDCDAWMKVAAIQHLARWFDSEKQLGLQTGHDSAYIDLDVTLQDPQSAKAFLESVLLSYATHCGIASVTHVVSPDALDRLVLASGAVPRDYLTLCGSSTQVAQQREKAQRVGVQDVNKAAGDAKQKKLDELEDDAASAREQSRRVLDALQRVRAFCVDEKNWSCFRIDFRDKEKCSKEYKLLEALMDLRLIHLIDPSLSDEHHAGHRAEVYMLDLSQYAGQRFKRKLRVLDYQGGHFVLKSTGTNRPSLVGNTPNKRLSLLRRAPLFALPILSSNVEGV